MRILVTGAAGLVGSAVAALLRRDHEVVGLDLRSGPGVDRVADIRGVRSLADFDAIVHVAALHAPHVGIASDAEFRSINVDATAALLEAALASGLSRFVFTSSTSVYGHALEPRDAAAAWIDEAVAPRPRDIYDVTKLAAEELVCSASRAGLATAILRMSRCFPEPAREMALHRLHRSIDRRDVARAHALALAAATTAAQIYVISGAPPFVPADCHDLFVDPAALIRLRVPVVADAFERRGWPLPRSIGRVYSPARAAATLGFTASYGAEAVLAGDCDPPPAPTGATGKSG